MTEQTCTIATMEDGDLWVEMSSGQVYKGKIFYGEMSWSKIPSSFMSSMKHWFAPKLFKENQPIPEDLVDFILNDKADSEK